MTKGGGFGSRFFCLLGVVKSVVKTKIKTLQTYCLKGS